MRLIVLLLASVVLALAQQPDEGNFEIRFEPIAKLQTGAPIPFQITVKDARRKPLVGAKITLQIERADHQSTHAYKAPAVDKGVYLAKPIFPSPGEWAIQVEVRLDNRMSLRTVQFSIPE